MKPEASKRLFFCCTALLLVAHGAAATDERSSVNNPYTAQRKPRVTVLRFDDTNANAQSARYGAAVEAMLVTFLKRKSQFVVVERQNIGDVLEEWQRNQRGFTNLRSSDPTARQVLEKLDGIILGKVTLLSTMAEAKTAGAQAKAARNGDLPATSADQERKKGEVIYGQRIEIDAKLLSRADGRIIAAAQRSGPVACLRSIVERLGIALEQEFLRPYYGSVQFKLSEPESVHVYLTPILLDTALDEERPPVEKGSSVEIGSDRDTIEAWVTDPTTYAIDKILSGWYSMRLERPGYDGIGTDNARWEAHESFGHTTVRYGRERRPLEAVAPALKSFVVRVDPQRSEVIDGDGLGFSFRKQGGSLQPLINRQFLDQGYARIPGMRVLLYGDRKLDINYLKPPKEYADDQSCDLFDEDQPEPRAYGKTHVAAGQSFDFDAFKGGELRFEDYRGETVPVGGYTMVVWAPNYEPEMGPVTVHDRDRLSPTRTALVRSTRVLTLTSTGPAPKHTVTLEGANTHYRSQLALDSGARRLEVKLPVDRYSARTDIRGLGGWRGRVELRTPNPSFPHYVQDSDAESGLRKVAVRERDDAAPALLIKTGLYLGGNPEAFSTPPSLLPEDVFVDRDLGQLLAALLPSPQEQDRHGSRLGRQILANLQQSLERAMPVPPAAPRPRPRGALEPPPTLPVLVRPTLVATLAGGAPPAIVPVPLRDGAGTAAPPKLPTDPEELHDLFARHLQGLDLLVLDDGDMRALQRRPDVAALVRQYVDAGGALFAFVSDGGDFGQIVGSPLTVEDKQKRTRRFELAAGEVAGVALPAFTKKVRVKAKRRLPRVERLPRGGDWRVVAFTKGHKDPRIVERGWRDLGGYAAIWCDDPSSFTGRRGGTVEKVEESRLAVEQHVLNWARFLMYRRYDGGSELRARSEAESRNQE